MKADLEELHRLLIRHRDNVEFGNAGGEAGAARPVPASEH